MSPLEATFRALYPTFLPEQHSSFIVIIENGRGHACVRLVKSEIERLGHGNDLVDTLRSTSNSLRLLLKDQGVHISTDGDVSDKEIEMINRAGALIEKSKGHIKEREENLFGIFFKPIPNECWQAGFVRANFSAHVALGQGSSLFLALSEACDALEKYQ